MSKRTDTKDVRAPSSEDAKLMLTVEGNVISAKEFSWVSGGLMGCAALQTDGSRRLFAVNDEPTELEFYGLDKSIRTLAFKDRKLLVFEAAGLDDRDELPWLEYDNSGAPVEGQIETDLLDVWLDKVW
jgi:hypothetical protein